MRRTLFVTLAAGLALVLTATAAWVEFSPDSEYTLSDTKAGANPEVSFHTEQDAGEEELAKIKLTIPKGFSIPADAQIEDGTQLGSGEIVIAVGPGCANPAIPVTVPAPVPVDINERDLTDAEAQQGFKAAWIVDLRPVTTIDLLIKGNRKIGHTLEGDIPANPLTCPPFSFDATFQAEAGGTKLYINPKKAGTYTFGVEYRGVAGSIFKYAQKIKITK